MKFPELIPAEFIKRHNRFSAGVRLASCKAVDVYVPTTGRLTGVLQPGCQVWLEPAENPARKTRFTMALAELESGGFCSTNAHLANRLFYDAVNAGELAAFPYREIDREVTFGDSRLDFRLFDGEQVCWVEVKSVTFAEAGIGRFPDAPTARGRRHLGELAKLTALGNRASVVFVAQREDALKFAPFEDIDPGFAEVLRQIVEMGVEAHAYRCQVSAQNIIIDEEIPVDLIA